MSAFDEVKDHPAKKQEQKGSGPEGLTVNEMEELKKAMTEARKTVKNRGQGGFQEYVG
ncbi:hypothetical protein OLMES_4461 [Oleiphilus messinensis]|uniref:Uncharacterized protein n=1 Tax=Oleiphilus messinensis TaxID=141451 RepID=A0A1Y0ID52_9GAMM|nr:hypothetical protein [Oleiphilus messinensis]ARU58457.1 hypothetical protein OLMES_4461 [Oleiphilus messinensis]